MKKYQTKKRIKEKQIFKIKTAVLLTAVFISFCAISGNAYMPEAEASIVDVKVPSKVQIYPAESEMKEWVLTRVYEAGLNPEEAERIIDCESKWNQDAHAVNWNNKAGVDRGLWQISSLHHAEVSNECAYDYKCATNEAIRIAKARQNWSAWSCARLLGL